eukprot:Blabericola_migrator_1__6749@NODE_340_length_9604_cov_22_008284_g273_i0_p1_GENE_NODE_340_length_9604_cov_22_008284_g273_i0NODE_340_length_9604_cov_22_008284_g273_i0_p1_ORF_typecomplete_len1030_score135_91_NODE_340_length_9604_cov_22_008284_g273_i03193408
MRAFRVKEQRWLIDKSWFLRGAATLAVLPQSIEQPGDVWSSAGTDNVHSLTTPPLRQSSSLALRAKGTPSIVTVSPINPWILGNVAQHRKSDGALDRHMSQEQTTTSSATDPEVPLPSIGKMLSYSNRLGTSTTASGEQWPVLVGPANGDSASKSSQQRVLDRTTDDFPHRGIPAEHSAFQEHPNANATVQPSNLAEVRRASEQMTSQGSLHPSASRKRWAEEEPDSESYLKKLRVGEVARLLFDERDQSVAILEGIMQSMDTKGQDNTSNALQPYHNATPLTITHGGLRSYEGGLEQNSARSISQAGIVDQAFASNDLQLNNSMATVGSAQRMQTGQNVKQFPQYSTESLNDLYRFLEKDFDDAGKDSVEPSHGSAHPNALFHSTQHLSSRQMDGTRPARPATRLDPPSTSDSVEITPVETCMESSSKSFGTMGYSQEVDECSNVRLHPVSHAECPEALSLNCFLMRGAIKRIVLPQDPSQYLEHLYDVVKRFAKKYARSVDDSGSETKQQRGATERDFMDYFKIIRARGTRHYTAHYLSDLIEDVEGWLNEQSNGPRDEFAHFALNYLRVINNWPSRNYEAKWCKAMVAEWCGIYQGLSEALRLAATQSHVSMRGRFSITLPDIYLKTCPYFLMYAVHHPDPKWSKDPGISTKHCDSEIAERHRARLLHELTNAAYLWQMVLYVNGKAAQPEWPSDPPINDRVTQAEYRSDNVNGGGSSVEEWDRLPIVLYFALGRPLELGRLKPDLLAQAQAIESSMTISSDPCNAVDLYEAVGSFRSDDASPFDKGQISKRMSLVKDDPLKSFWRLRVLFHAHTCKIVRYQLDKLVMETESKMQAGILPEDPFLRFACDYLRMMRTWDTLGAARYSLAKSVEVTQRLFKHFSDKHKVTDAVKKVAEMESKSKGLRLLPEIYKTYPASSLLPYIAWWDTKTPEAIAEMLRKEGVTHDVLKPRKTSDERLKAMTSRLLTIIAEIWNLREIDGSPSSHHTPQQDSQHCNISSTLWLRTSHTQSKAVSPAPLPTSLIAK